MISRRSLMTALPALGLVPAWSRAQAPAPEEPLVGRFQMVGNRPFTQVYFGDEGPFRFLIDTGAGVAVIDPAIAARLNFPRLADAELQGATAQRTVEIYAARDMFIGDSLRQRGAVRMAGGKVAGGFDGLLPGAVFTGANAEIDFAAREFRFWPGPPDRTGFTRLPLVAAPGGPGDRRLTVGARIDGRAATLLVDTGGVGSVLLSGEYVGKNRLWDRYPRFAAAEGVGMLRSFPLRIVRGQRLQLGGHLMERPVLNLTDPFNPPGDAGDGALGMDVLHRFTLATDPAGKALWMKPNAAFKDAFRYNRAGLETGFAEGRFMIRAVQPGTPAERAGLMAGDGLPKLQSVRDLSLFDWYLTEEPGTKLDFEVQRGETRLPVSLVLEELL